MKNPLTASLLGLALVAPAAYALPVDLNFAFVAAPGINCFFDPSCTVTVTDTTAPVPMPGYPPDAPFFLQSRTFTGAPGSPAAGLYGYEYRIDLSNPAGLVGPDECIWEIAIDFGPIVPFDFDGDGIPDFAYVIRDGGLGTIEPTAVIQNGSRVSLVFALEADTGLISDLCVGESSFFIGLVSTQPPVATTVALDDPADGGAQKGIPLENIPARAPRTNPLSVIQQAIAIARRIPLSQWKGPNNSARTAHQNALIGLLDQSAVRLGAGQADAATQMLIRVARNIGGPAPAWLMNDPDASPDLATLLYENVATAANLLAPGSLPMIEP